MSVELDSIENLVSEQISLAFPRSQYVANLLRFDWKQRSYRP